MVGFVTEYKNRTKKMYFPKGAYSEIELFGS
jgi:hypothetical protein